VRTHYCAEVNEEHIGQEVTVAGWVSSRRDHGGLIFIDLRDKDQVIQLVCDPADNVDVHKIAEEIRDQFVLVATGKMRARGEGLENPKLKTGKVEMVVDKLVIENRSKPMPFELNDEKVNEEINFQIAKCFRDEDLRADRQPEFTQIDVEMSFCDQEDVIKVAEKLISDVFIQCGFDVPTKFKRMLHKDAMENYGSDKPDMRYDLKMVDVIDIFERCDNEIFSKIAATPKKNRIKALKVPKGDEIFSKRQMKGFEEYVRKFGASGLGYFQMKEDGLKGPLAKFFTEDDLQAIIDRCELEVGDAVFFGAGEKKLVLDYMGRFRIYLAEIMDIIPEDTFEFLWVMDFPMFEVEDGKVKALHHPFTPHGGFALGLDRMIMIMTGASSIREVIAFPKTQKAQCLLTQAPSEVDAEQLKDLNLRIRQQAPSA